jgi:hypothetical protein
MNPLKGGRFDIHFHRRDAEHAEDLFNILLSAEEGGKQKSAAFRSFNLLLSIRYPHKWFVCLSKLKAFPLPSSQRQRKNNIISAIFASRAKRAVYAHLPTLIEELGPSV